MPQPYTDASLKAELHAVLGRIAQVLGYTVVAGSYDLVVSDTKAAIQQDSIEDYTANPVDPTSAPQIAAQWTAIRTVQALSRIRLWQQAITDLATAYDMSTSRGSWQRSQMVKTAQAQLEAAQKDIGRIVKDPILDDVPDWVTTPPEVFVDDVAYRSPWPDRDATDWLRRGRSG